jgi:hypothetical protein
MFKTNTTIIISPTVSTVGDIHRETYYSQPFQRVETFIEKEFLKNNVLFFALPTVLTVGNVQNTHNH